MLSSKRQNANEHTKLSSRFPIVNEKHTMKEWEIIPFTVVPHPQHLELNLTEEMKTKKPLENEKTSVLVWVSRL